MRFRKLALAVLLAVIAGHSILRAQSTIGTISGRVFDAQGAAMPGVVVTVQSPNLQGLRTTVTTEQGDYLFPVLPSGAYVVSFELQGFERLERTVQVVATHTAALDVTLGLDRVSESVTVAAATPAEVLTRTSQSALNLKQDLVSSLPNNRDITAAMLLAPSVHASGPLGAFSISGGVSNANLFLLNGVTINENIRGQPNTVYIEDAIQETTVASSGISAEFGRFTGGVVNVITKSGGNQFSGSFRESYNNDRWRALTPFEVADIAAAPTKVTRLNDTVPTHEYTLGGPILKDRLWFFTAGRLQTQAERRSLVFTDIPYDLTRLNRRYEGKITFSPQSNHRIQGTVTKIVDNSENHTWQASLSMDRNSLGTRKQPQELYSVHYSGVVAKSLVVEGVWSRRDSSSIGAGAKTRDRIDGTLLIDRSRNNSRYWSDTFCGVCPPEQRDNENVNVKASYFLSNRRAGTHTMTFGYDNFNDKRSANNYQSGSDYRIAGTGAIIRGQGVDQVIYPQFIGSNDSTLVIWTPIPVLSRGNNFRTHGLFFADSWRVNGRLTANLGVRHDRNDGRDQEGKLVVTTGATSPRVGMVFDPTGSNTWAISANVAQFVESIANTVADASSSAGNPQSYQFLYRGPNINADPAGPLVDTRTALTQLFAWYDEARENGRLVRAAAPNLPGISTRIAESFKSPKVLEYAAGVSRQFDRGSARVDYVFRDWRDMYSIRTDMTTGQVTNSEGQRFDLGYVENSSRLTRRYSGASFQGTYRVANLDTGATYTLSRLWGNNDGENRNGPTAATAYQYPEYKQESWNNPTGDLSADQRHRARFWAVYNVPGVSGLSVSGTQLVESGLPYGAVSTSGVNPTSYVVAPGYATPPSGNSTTYYFTARDAFRTEGQRRFDFAATYKHGVRAGGRSFDLFIQGQVINTFNQMQLCACGGTVFQNGGGIDVLGIDQTVRTPVSPAGLPLAPFNPFTTTPVENVNWAKGPRFGTALHRLAYTTPRQLRITLGVRF